MLVDVEELSYEEAADALACPVGTVRSRLHRARKLLFVALRDPERRRGGTKE
jgi:RNA polymerase sigma-70 factor (ECF subfamily)